MSKSPRVLVWGFGFCLGLVLIGPAGAAEKRSSVETAEARILAAFEESTQIEFIDEPLTSFLSFLKDFYQIEIQIDEPALKDMGINKDEPVTASLQGISLRSALNLVLHDLGLDWTIANEVLLITSPDVAETTMVTRVYDMGDLILVRDADGRTWRDFDSMVELLTTTVEPESWDEVGGPGSIASFEFRGAAGLVIRHTPKVHHQVARLVKDLADLAEKHGDDVYPTRDTALHPGPEGFGADMVGKPGSMMGMGGGFAPGPACQPEHSPGGSAEPE